MNQPKQITNIYFSSQTAEYFFEADQYHAVGRASAIEDVNNKIVGTIPLGSLPTDATQIDWSECPQTLQDDVSAYIVNTSNRKGKRNEREAVNLLGRVRGSGNVARVSTFTNHDPFRLADIIAVGSDRPVLFVQVKTTSFTNQERAQYRRRMHRLNHSVSHFEVWVREDYRGWTIYRYNPTEDAFIELLHLETLDTETTVTALRDLYSKSVS